MDNAISVRGCVFDNDGTLIDQERDHFAALFETAARFGVELDFAAAIERIPSFMGGGYEATAAYVSLRRCGAHDEPFMRAFCAAAADAFTRITASKALCPRPGVVDFLQKLLDHDIPIALATATERARTIERLSQSGLSRFFTPERILTRESTRLVKPAPDIYLASAGILRLAPNAQLVFEDSAAGVRAAAEAGSPVIAVAAIEEKTLLAALQASGALAVFTSWEDQRLRQLAAGVLHFEW